MKTALIIPAYKPGCEMLELLERFRGNEDFVPVVVDDGSGEGFAPIFDSGNSMFYNVPFENLSKIKFDEIKTHSFIERECKLLQYVRNRSLVDIGKAEMDFSIYEKDIVECQIRIPILRDLYERKRDSLCAFQNGKDIWKDSRYR